MHFKNYLLFLLIGSYFQIYSQSVNLDYYLPEISYNSDISTPEQFLGYQVGDWHVSHDQLHFYMKHVAAQSNRIVIKEIGRTHENRPLLNLIITSPKNHDRLDEIQAEHRALTDPSKSAEMNINDIPIVIYQGYSIHGNEASGSNAALLNAYYLAAGQSDHINDLLDHAVIIIDPSYNPDGLHRFSTWANQHKGKHITSDPNHREYRETWPGGRTNHYWFDLNRDWLLLTHPESQARIKVFHQWKPDIVTDHHEMGTNSTFFFQPGVPDRTNPNTPNKNQELTFEIAKFHAAALDKIGSLYYTKESFDDYYYGKGSTYPDINGGIGILFEQASSRGHAQESVHGKITFPFTIRNQFTTSLSTQDAGLALRKDILTYKRKFYQEARLDAQKSKTKAYVFGNNIDPVRTERFVKILQSHDINVYGLSKNVKIARHSFSASNAYIVPTDQYQYKLIKTIFEEVKTFKDSLFYDVSAWTLPHAFDLNYGAISRSARSYIGVSAKMVDKEYYSPSQSEPYGYLSDWAAYGAPTFLDALLKKDIIVRVSHKGFTTRVNGKKQSFRRGTLVIPSQNQPLSSEELSQLIKQLANDHKVPTASVLSGFTNDGFSLGSPSMSSLKSVKSAILVGSGVNGYDAGAAWHQMDKNFKIATPLLDINNIGRVDLGRYDAIIMPDGNYNALNGDVEKIKTWITSGGNLIASKRAIDWLISHELCSAEKADSDSSKNKATRTYENRSKERGSKVTGGVIVNMEVDLSHPLFYGYNDKYIATFKKGNNYYKLLKDSYNTPGKYTSSPVLSGYLHQNNLIKLRNSPAVFVDIQGRGKVIAIVDNPNFRGYWWGTSKLFANAIFMGQVIN
ncbi:MAG: M14 metallopeptidase family protein [Saprospiraceae bacterium]